MSGNYHGPTYFFEFDPVENALHRVPDPPTSGGAPYLGRLILLPTGQALFANGSTNVQAYTPTGTPDSSWKPNITSVPTTLVCGDTYTLRGRQISGLSQAVSYGDDASMATNYPIVRVQNLHTNHISYCRTSGHSTLGVNTGSVVHHTGFTVPVNAEPGPSTICVVANGIASDPTRVIVNPKRPQEAKGPVVS